MQRQALPSSKKTHSERHKQILKQLLKEDANRTCVDCKTSAHPRWASWNLGCFICIRCSGIHRSMGVHISKVKSVDLDAWTDDQVESMVKWGNLKCNSYWEAKLPEGYVPDPLKIENFIRTKYEMKKWVGSSSVPDPLLLKNTSKPATTATPATKPAAPAPTVAPKAAQNLLDDDFGSFASASARPKTKSSTLPKLPIQTSTSTVNSPQSTGGSNRPDLKKSILSLYSTPSSSSSSFIQRPPQQATGSNTSLANSLQGLNLSSTPSPAPAPLPTTSVPNSSTSAYNGTTAWTNEWADAPAGSSKLNVSLDDDLFKNVWK